MIKNAREIQTQVRERRGEPWFMKWKKKKESKPKVQALLLLHVLVFVKPEHHGPLPGRCCRRHRRLVDKKTQHQRLELCSLSRRRLRLRSRQSVVCSSYARFSEIDGVVVDSFFYAGFGWGRRPTRWLDPGHGPLNDDAFQRRLFAPPFLQCFPAKFCPLPAQNLTPKSFPNFRIGHVLMILFHNHHPKMYTFHETEALKVERILLSD